MSHNQSLGDPKAEEEEGNEEESASSVLRRLSSPIYGGGFDSDSDGCAGRRHHFESDHSEHGAKRGGADEEKEEEEELREGAAELVQRWWRTFQRDSKRVRTVVAARPAFVRVQQLFEKLDAGQMSFERTGLALQNPDIQRAVTKALAAVPRDETLIAIPRAARSTRAVLSSLMIVYHPEEVLMTEGEADGDGATAAASSTTPPSPTRLGSSTGDEPGVTAPTLEHWSPHRPGGLQKMEPVAAALRNASALLVASIKAVTASLGAVVAGVPGARKTLEVRLNVLRFSRRYFAVSLVSWKDKDATRVAAQVVQPYARAYAMILAAVAEGDERVAEMVQGQLGQYRRALEHLIGQERASNSLQEVELAVLADLKEQMPISAPTTAPNPPASNASPPPSSSAAVTGESVTTPATTTASSLSGTTNSSSKNGGGKSGGGDSSSTGSRTEATSRAAAAAADGKSNVGASVGASDAEGAPRGERGGGAGASEGGNEVYLIPDGRLGRLLGSNERLAHEILVNPDFQIPATEDDDAAVSSPEEVLARRFKDVMRRIFWDRFTQSLLPPPPPRPTGPSATGAVATEGGGGGTDEAEPQAEVPGLPPLQVGSKVHARYGSDRGSYYVATILAVAVNRAKTGTTTTAGEVTSPRRPDAAPTTAGVPPSPPPPPPAAAAAAAAAISERGGAEGEREGEREGHSGAVFVDVRYDEDGMVERGIPVSRLKKWGDPPDFGPLLALLGEVREELVSLTPNNATLVAEVRAVLSQERLAEMLQDKTLDARQVQKLVGFIASRIFALQAPIRESGARTWLKAFDAKMDAAAASGDAFAIVPLLPRAFEFVFSQMEEIKRDSANAHIRLLAPYLNRHGAAYERAKFEARMSSGAVALVQTKTWLSSAVKGFVGSDPAEGGSGDEGERARRLKGLRDGREEVHKNVLREAFIGLLRSPVRLDRPEAAASILPETLSGDGGRLAAGRDDVDRVALVATLCVLVRQVLARLRIGCPAPAMAALQAKSSALLKQEGVSLPQIVEECLATAGRLAVASSPKEGTATGGLPAAEEAGLRSLLMSSADPNNEIFRVFFKRVLLALKGIVAGGDVAEVCGRNGLQSFVEELRPAGARLQRLFAHNVKVHAGHYGPIVTEAALSLTLS